MVILALNIKEHMVVFQKIHGKDHRTYLSNKTNKEERVKNINKDRDDLCITRVVEEKRK